MSEENRKKKLKTIEYSEKIQTTSPISFFSRITEEPDHFTDSYFGKDGKKHRLTPKDSIAVYLRSNCGIRLEFLNVPRKYYVADLAVLVIKDTGLKYDTFQIRHNNDVLKSIIPLMNFVQNKREVFLEMFILDTSIDGRQLKLGDREISFKSGLTIDVKGKKESVTNDRCSLENVLHTETETNKSTKKLEVDIKWLDPSHHKPFLGGYRDKLTSAIFHNASAQTRRCPKPILTSQETEVTSRDTQTYKMRHFGQTTLNQMSTQFSKPGFFVSCYRDKVQAPGKYETSEEYLARILRQVSKLKCIHEKEVI